MTVKIMHFAVFSNQYEMNMIGHQDKSQHNHTGPQRRNRNKIHPRFKIFFVPEPNPVFQMGGTQKKPFHLQNLFR